MTFMRRRRDEWAKRVELWKDSGLTAKEFASELGVNPRSLVFWKWQLGKAVGKAPKESQAPATSRSVNVRRRCAAPADLGARDPERCADLLLHRAFGYRFGFDRMAQTVRERVGQEPQHGGALFVFRTAERRA
jgi:hypothetical protein